MEINTKFSVIYFECFPDFEICFYFRSLIEMKRFIQFLLDNSSSFRITYCHHTYSENKLCHRKRSFPKFSEFSNEKLVQYLNFMDYSVEVGLSHNNKCLEIFYNKFTSWAKRNNHRYYTFYDTGYCQPRNIKEFYCGEYEE